MKVKFKNESTSICSSAMLFKTQIAQPFSAIIMFQSLLLLRRRTRTFHFREWSICMKWNTLLMLSYICICNV